MLRSLIVWLPMIVIAFANGAFREAVLRRHFSETAARQLSTVLLLILFAIYIGWASRRRPVATSRAAIARGTVWLVLTLAFEFGLGAMTGKSLQSMLSEYDVTAGRIWILVPLWVAIAPWVFFRLAARR